MMSFDCESAVSPKKPWLLTETISEAFKLHKESQIKVTSLVSGARAGGFATTYTSYIGGETVQGEDFTIGDEALRFRSLMHAA